MAGWFRDRFPIPVPRQRHYPLPTDCPVEPAGLSSLGADPALVDASPCGLIPFDVFEKIHVPPCTLFLNWLVKKQKTSRTTPVGVALSIQVVITSGTF
jgi:hypothetical protein